MSSAAFSASRRPLFFLLTLAGVALSLALSGCAGVISPTNAGTTSDPTGSLSISNVQASGATNSSVQLSWATNEPATSAIDYGTTTAYGVTTPVSSSMVTAHHMALAALAQGTTYHFRVRSTSGTDSAASSDQTFSTTGGNTPPSVQVTSPAAGATLSGKVNLTAVASDGGTVKGVQFRVDGNNVGPDLASSPYAYVLDSSTLSNGSHSISAVATDNTGNSATSASIGVRVDNSVKDTTPPTVSITAPSNGAKVTGVVAVTANASDNVSVASVQFELDGTNVGARELAAPYAYSWDTTKSANGSHTLKAIATDGAGNSATSALVTVTVNNNSADKTPPSVSITSPAPSATVSGTVNVTASASDNTGVAGVQFQVDGVNAGALEAAAPYGIAWDTTKVANGAHRLDAIASDAAGNTTTSATVSVTVNNTAVNNFSISGTVSGSGAAGTAVTLTGAAVAATTTSATGAYSFTGLAKGNYTVTVSHTGFTFTPASLAAAITTANVTGINFASTAVSTQTFSISGTISGTGGPGSTVTLSGASTATTTASASGAYTFAGLAKGSYTATPSHAGFTFSPASLAEAITTANITGANFTATATAPQTFSISGTISGSGGNGATVTLSGASAAATTANASGAFSFAGLARGSYTVTPTHAGFTFGPTSQAATITAANVTGMIFTSTASTPQTFSISGTISGSGGNGATVTLTGASSATATANASGVYTFTGLAKGNYTVTPRHTGFTFTPTSLAETITNANVTGANFISIATAPQTFSISGTVTGSGASGTTLTLSGTASATTTANSSGAFTFSGLAKGTYAVTPSHSGFTFSPTSLAETITTANITGANFTSTAAATFSISGTITPTSGGGGATVTLSGAAAATTTTSSSGAYTFTGLANGSYTVTPNNSGFAFTPASSAVTISGASKTGVNFTAASNAPHAVTLNWSASTSKVSGYNVYRSTTSGSGFAKINSSLVTTTTFEDSSVTNGNTYFYVTTSVDSTGDESSDSNQVSVTIP
jgi:Big-like domain-containing protein/carboxypeptidase family protein/SdrD B-like protein